MATFLVSTDLDKRAIRAAGLASSEVKDLNFSLANVTRKAGFKPWRIKNIFYSSNSYENKEAAARALIRNIMKYAPQIIPLARFIDVIEINGEIDILKEIEMNEENAASLSALQKFPGSGSVEQPNDDSILSQLDDIEDSFFSSIVRD